MSRSKGVTSKIINLKLEVSTLKNIITLTILCNLVITAVVVNVLSKHIETVPTALELSSIKDQLNDCTHDINEIKESIRSLENIVREPKKTSLLKNLFYISGSSIFQSFIQRAISSLFYKADKNSSDTVDYSQINRDEISSIHKMVTTIFRAAKLCSKEEHSEAKNDSDSRE